MSESRKPQIGSSTLTGFFGWINERTAIYNRRASGATPPWTDDAILQRYKFTNAFRELDRGTVALHKMIWQDFPVKRKDRGINLADVVFNIWWYRLFNRAEHAINPGFCDSAEEVLSAMRFKEKDGFPVFTGAHMTSSAGGVTKLQHYHEAVEQAFDNSQDIVDLCRDGRMQVVFNRLLLHKCLGPFVAYEICCDLRYVPALWPQGYPTDVYSWANIGPGAKRGLNRLGLKPELDSMIRLWWDSIDYLSDEVRKHHPRMRAAPEYPYFELREIEHSLCEFDKYERVRRGEGRPRGVFKDSGERRPYANESIHGAGTDAPAGEGVL